MKIKHKLGLINVFLVAVMVAFLAAGHNRKLILGASTEVTPPTAPIAIKATADDQGVTVYWQAAQDGTYPVHSYQVFKQGGDGQLSQIGEVSSDLTQYLDTTGKEGNVYEVATSDDQQPADVSAYSDVMTAAVAPPPPAPIATVESPTTTPTETPTTSTPTEPPPASTPPESTTPPAPSPEPTPTANTTTLAPTPTATPMAVAPLVTTLPPAQVSPSYVPPELLPSVNPQDVQLNSVGDLTKNIVSLPADTSKPLGDQQVQQVQKATNTQVEQLATVIVTAKQPLVAPILSQYSEQTQQLYQHYNQLSTKQKTVAKNACQAQENALETQLLNLPESYQMDLFIAIAHCHLINQQP